MCKCSWEVKLVGKVYLCKVNTVQCLANICNIYINSSFWISLQHVDEENSYLCGYLKIKGLTEEFPTLTTFFDGEIISAKYPFLTRKWDADEDVDRKHWVSRQKCHGKMTDFISGWISIFTNYLCRVLMPSDILNLKNIEKSIKL